MATEDLTRAKYAGRDFWTLFDDLKVRIREKYGSDYNDFMESSIGVMLLDLMSWAADTLYFYLDRQATDTYMDTVQTRTAAERLARQLGYKMYGAVSSSVDLTVTIDDVWGFSVTIPEGFKFKGPNDLVFEATQDVVFSIAEQGPGNSKTVSVREGETRTKVFISDGTKNQRFDLTGIEDDKFLVDESVEVRVDGELWEERDFLEFEESNHYEIAYRSSPPQLRFGDGTAGNLPTSGSTISVEYVVGSGKSGFVTSGSIDDVVTALRQSGNEIPMTVTNEAASSGGTDGESVLHAKTYAPRYYKTRQVAVTREDFETLASAFADTQFGAVAKAQAVSARGADDDLYLSSRLTTIRTASDDPYPTVVSETDGITDDLEDISDEVTSIGDDVTAIENVVGTPRDPVAPADPTGLYLTAEEATDSIRETQNSQDKISSDGQDAYAFADEAQNDSTNGLGVVPHAASGTNFLEDAIWNFINDRLAWIKNEGTNIQGYASSSKTALDTALGKIDDIETGLDDVRSGSGRIDASKDNISTEVTSISTHVTAILAVVVDTSTTVNTACDEVYSHVDEFLSLNCKANLVEVPILTKDPDGFYTAPSTALISALQVYLDERKEPTVTVKVMSGNESLVEAVITVELGVSEGVVKSKVKSTAETIIDGILKERNFGVSLYRSQLTDPLASITGIRWVNVAIIAPSEKVDSSGNLVIDTNEVITKGTVTVTTTDAE